METLAICNDSFSYSWLMPVKAKSFDALDDTLGFSLDTLDDALFIEMDLKSSRRITSLPPDMDFNFPNSQSLTVVPADQLFRNGHLLPLHLTSQRKDRSSYLSDQPPTPEFSETQQSDHLRQQPSFLRRCRRSSKQVLLMYWSFLQPLCRKMRKLKTNRLNRGSGSYSSSSSSSSYSCSPATAGSRGSKSRTPSLLTSRSLGTRSCTESLQTTPRNSVGHAGDDWRRYDKMSGSDIENSIQAAILHCKKSIGIIDNLELSFSEKKKLGR